MKTRTMWFKRAAMLLAMAGCALAAQDAFAAKADVSAGGTGAHLEDAASLTPTPMPRVKATPKSSADTYEATGDLGITMRHGDTMRLYFDIDKAYTRITSARLVMHMWDVDYPSATEQDNVYFNGTYLGRLEGLNQGWDYNYFDLPISKITVPSSGESISRNTVTINVSVDPSGWVTQCGSAQLIINGDTFSLTASRNITGGISVNWDNVYGSYDLWRKGPDDSDFTRIRQGITTNGCFDADVQIGKPYTYYAIQSGAKSGGAKDATPNGASNTDEGLAGQADLPRVTLISVSDIIIGKTDEVCLELSIQDPNKSIQDLKGDVENSYVAAAAYYHNLGEPLKPEFIYVSSTPENSSGMVRASYKVSTKVDPFKIYDKPDLHGWYVWLFKVVCSDGRIIDVQSADGKQAFRGNIYFKRDMDVTGKDGKIVPAWFEYWKASRDGVCSQLTDEIIYDNGKMTGWNPDNKDDLALGLTDRNRIYLGKDVVHYPNCEETLIGVPQKLHITPRRLYDENNPRAAIDVQITCAHEKQHRANWAQYLIDTVLNKKRDADREMIDGVLYCDSLSDDTENQWNRTYAGLNLKTDKVDSYSVGSDDVWGGYYARMGDDEVIARIEGAKYLPDKYGKAKGVFAENDFAYPGMQLPFLSKSRTNTKAICMKTDTYKHCGGVLPGWPLDIGLDETEWFDFSIIGTPTTLRDTENNLSAVSFLRFPIAVSVKESAGIVDNDCALYLIKGYLADANDNPVAWTMSSVEFTNATMNVNLDFDGPSIYSSHSSGFTLKAVEIFSRGGDVVMVLGRKSNLGSTDRIYAYSEFANSGMELLVNESGDSVSADGLNVDLMFENAQTDLPFVFEASLSATNGNEIIARATTTNVFSTSSGQAVRLAFPKAEIAASGIDGQYRISSMTVSATGTVLTTYVDIYTTTNNYRAVDFLDGTESLSFIDGSAAFQSPVVAADGKLGKLPFVFSVMNGDSETIECQVAASLCTVSNKLSVATTSESVKLTNGINEVSLSFSSSDIAAYGYDGPYKVEITVSPTGSKGNRLRIRPDVATGEYKADDFGKTPVELVGTPVVNTSGSAPVVTLTVEGLRDCVYNASAVLLDSNREFVAYVVTTNTIAAGVTNTVTLAFDESVIIASGHRGPYILDYVMLEPQNGADAAKLYSGAAVSDIDYTVADAYVDAVNGSDSNGGTSWSDAYQTIQAAVNVSMSGDTILVADGTYAPFQTGNKEIAIMSRHGAASTIIDAGRSRANCVVAGTGTSHTNTIVSGFTLKGATGYVTQYGRFYNCITYDNYQGPYYGVFYNCTISDADQYIAYYSSFYNSIVWSTDHNNGIYCSSSSKYYNSCLQYNFNNGTGSNNLIGVNPKFLDAANRDYRLLPGSPCVDAGANDYVFGSVDALGKSRIQDGIVDIGAFEGTVQVEAYNGFKYIKKLNGEVLIVGWNEDLPADVVIPDKIDGGRVAEICAGAFSNCTAMTSIDFGTNAVHCGDYAFYGCSNLAAAYVDNLETWCAMKFGGYYFANPLRRCGKLYVAGELLENLVIPAGIANLSSYAFINCSSITNVDMGEAKYISSYAFCNCPNLLSVNLRRVEIAGYCSFMDCYGIIEVVNDGCLRRVEDFAFGWCYALKDFDFNEGIEYIGFQTFNYDYALTSVILPETLVQIAQNGFRGCTGIKELHLPQSLKTLGPYSFEGCTGLKSVVVPGAINTIGNKTFQNCSALEMVSIPASVTSISGEYALGNDPKLNAVYYEGNAPNVTITNLLYSGSTFVTNYVRYGSSGWGNTGYWQERPVRIVPFLYDVDNAGNAIITGYVGAVIGALEIPGVLFGHRVVAIGDRAFEWQDQMTSVVIPEGVISIGEGAFMDCLALESITLPQTLKEIGRFAFAACWSLDNITIPASVTDIFGSAFRGCQDLASVSFMGDAPNIDSAAFFGINTGITFIVPEGASGWDTYEGTYNIEGRAPLELVTTALPEAMEMVEYSTQLEATGGTPPYSWSCPARGYTVTTNSTSTFAEVGTAQGWHADDSYWTLELPFDFPFYGNKYRTAYVNSNGMISFGSGISATSYSANTFLANPIVAVLWRDLLTTGSSDVFVESGTENITIRWKAVYYSGGSDVNASISLSHDGSIKLAYGSRNDNGGFVGVSAGDGENFIMIDNTSYSRNHAQDIVIRNGGIANGLTLFENGQITGIPVGTGTNTFTVTLADATGQTEEKELSIVINENPNHKPVIDAVSPTTNVYVKVGDSTTFAVTAHDPEGETLEYIWYLDGEAIECFANTYTFTATLDDAGAHTLECVVSDGLWTDMVRHRWSFRVVRDWYVDASAEDDSGDGASSDSALYSISEALWYAEDGDTIYVAPGLYDDYLEFDSGRTVSIIATGGTSRTFFTGEVDGYDTEWYPGEAVVQSTMRGFTFRGCYLGGVTLDDCVLTCDEMGCYPSEVYGCRLFDCSVTGNTSDYSPIEQCELTRCTVAGNTVGEYGAVGYSSYVYDCIVWDNVTVNGETSNYDTETWYDEWWDDDAEEYVSEEYAEVHIFNSCTWPMPSGIAGTGNITSDPRLVDAVNGDLRLRVGSPCLVGGVQAMGVYLGDPVAGFVLSVRIEGSGAVSPMTAVVSNGGNATFEVADNTRPFLGFSTNGVFATAADTLTWQGVKSDGIITAVFSNFTFYVDAAAGDDANDGLSWATARASIQSAINDAVRGETIYVKAGTYDPIVVGAAMRLRIESVDGKEATVIDGGGERQCANLGGNDSFSSTLIGFALTNGYSSYGGGAHGGTLVDCDVMGNYARYQGGGLYYSTAIRCQIAENKAGDTNLWSNAKGGGAYSGTLRNCLVVGNTAESSNYCEGGASCYSALYNCTVVDNVARGNGYGGGVAYGNLYNSVVFGNHADYDDETQYVWTMQKSLIGVDPGFIDAENGDYRLAVGSPCIDAGSNGYVLDDADLDGNERIQHYTVDIGCYEYELATPERDADADFAEQMAGTCYGVFVGVGRYTYTSSLTGPTIDATNMQASCIAKGYWRDENTVAFLDAAATKAVVRAKLATLAAKAVSGDTVFYYQSSHGGSHTSGGYYTKDTYICLHDATYEDYEMAEDLMQFAAGVKVVIVLDTCHSAGMFKAMGESSPTSAKSFALRVRELMAERAALRKGVKSGITTDDIGWIAAADFNQYSWDSLSGGAFTVAMLDGWKSGEADYDGDNRLNFHELWRYARGIATGYYGEDATDAQCLNENVLLSRFAGTPDSTSNGESTETTPAPVEHVWLDSYPAILAAFGGDYEAMANAPSPGVSGNGKTWPNGSPCYVWQDFVAGTSPTNDTVFTATIYMNGNTPVITWEPDTPELRATRVYRTYGKKTLMDANWTDITDKDMSEYHFFKVTVDLP